ncbi:MAG: substrate-binding domain-containing protein, partial [Caldilineales bacterium]|nr:substrate-binding domain-containing protein [Caldilineales bacterium]
MRRYVVFVALVVLALVVAACGGGATPTPTPVPPTPTPAPAQPAQPQPTPTPAPAQPAQPTPAPSVVSEPTIQLPEVNPLEVKGDIIMAGSSTVYPLAERMAERFREEGYAGNITIDSIGTGAGFERFCKAGETDISTASRPIKSSEVENCKAIGRTPVEFRVGTDALAVVVNPANDWIGPEGLTVEQVA